MKEPERDMQKEGERCRDSQSCEISDSHREKLAQLEIVSHREADILIQTEKQVKMKKINNI